MATNGRVAVIVLLVIGTAQLVQAQGTEEQSQDDEVQLVPSNISMSSTSPWTTDLTKAYDGNDQTYIHSLDGGTGYQTLNITFDQEHNISRVRLAFYRYGDNWCNENLATCTYTWKRLWGLQISVGRTSAQGGLSLVECGTVEVYEVADLTTETPDPIYQEVTCGDGTYGDLIVIKQTRENTVLQLSEIYVYEGSSTSNSTDSSHCSMEYWASPAAAARYTSPNYPNEYSSYHDSCNTTIRAEDGQQIKLNFEAFELEYNSACSYDYLEIRDGDSSTSSLLGRYCGYTSPGNIRSSGNALWLEFHSDSSVTRDGFLAYFMAVSESDNSTDGSTDDSSDGSTDDSSDGSTEDPTEYESTDESSTDESSASDNSTVIHCDAEYFATAAAAQYTSPAYPDEYPNNHDSCNSTIYAEEGQQVQLDFEAFELEYNSACSYDYLEVRDGDSASSPYVGRFCGSDLPASITSSGNSLWVEFHSDSSVSRSGYLAYFRAIDVTCSKPSIENGSVRPSNGTIEVGESYTARCHDGYTLYGDAEMECDDDGTLTSAPNCTETPYCWTESPKTQLNGTRVAKLYNLHAAKSVCEFLPSCTAVSCHRNTHEKGCKLYSETTGSESKKPWTSYEYGPCE